MANDTQTVSAGIPGPPIFDTVEETRTYLKSRLAGAFRLFAQYGFDEGVAGHITVRDPEHKDHFWVNPFGFYFGQIKASDLVLVNHEGNVVEGKHPLVNRAAFAIHSQIHMARPDVTAAAHSHSTYGRTWSSLGRLLDPITQDACAFYEDHVLFDDYTGIVNELEEGKRIAETLDMHKAAILKNHGLLTVGHSVDEAAWWFITMERSCQVQLMAESVGTPTNISPEVARHTREQLGSNLAGWFQFQPLWQKISALNPDILE